MKNVVAIFGARGGSKGLPGKNIKPFLGKPLMYWTIKALKDAQLVKRIIVSTDDEKIAAIARDYGAETPFLLPKNLAEDGATMEDMLAYTVNEVEKQEKKPIDIVVYVQMTDIFRKKGMIDTVVRWLIDDPKLESAFVAYSTHKKYWEETDEGHYKRLTSKQHGPRQKSKHIYREDTGIACATRASIIKGGYRLGDQVRILANDDENTGIDIHTPEDFWLAEQIAKREQQKKDSPYYFGETP